MNGPGVHLPGLPEKLKWGSLEKLSNEFSRTDSCILGALSKLDDFLLNRQVRTCSVAVPGTSRNFDSENRETSGDRSPSNPISKAVFSVCHSSNVNDSGQEETHHTSWRKNLYFWTDFLNDSLFVLQLAYYILYFYVIHFFSIFASVFKT